MEQTSKRVLSLLMALTMLIGMMTAVAVGAVETVEWKLVKEWNFDDKAVPSEFSQLTSNKSVEIITDSVTGSMYFTWS